MPSTDHENESVATGRVPRMLGWLAHMCSANPMSTLAFATAVTALAAYWSATRLEFHTSRLDLLSPKSSYNIRWLNYLDKFGYEDDAIVVVSHPDPQRVSVALTDAGRALESDSTLSGVLYRKSLGTVAHKALQLMPEAELGQLFQLVLACSQAIQSVGSQPVVSAELRPEAQIAAEQAMAQVRQLPAAITQAVVGLDRLRQTVPEEGPLLLEDDGKLGLCLVRLPHPDRDPDVARDQIAKLDRHLAQLRSHHPGVEFWLTGIPILEWDESLSSQRDMQRATFLSLVGVALIFVVGFGSWRLPMVAVICLAVGLIWTVGLTTILIGHLNLFSVAFGAILAGLGIDYSIHLLARLQMSAKHHPEIGLLSAIRESVEHCGTGILTGAVTTAAAFLVAMLTPFRGITELGLICGMGTICCMVATLTVLPALIVIQAEYLPQFRWQSRTWGSWNWVTGMRPGRWHHALDHSALVVNQLAIRFRWLVLLFAIAMSLLSAVNVGRVTYDHNLLNLQAEGIPSVKAERELIARCGQSAWFAISLASSPEEANRLRNKFLKLPSVDRIEEIGSVLALSNSQGPRHQFIAQCASQAQELLQRVREVQTKANLAHQPLPAGIQSISHTTAPMESSLPDQMELLANSIAKISTPNPIGLEDFPPAVRERMASHDGQTFLLRIFSRENLWQRENLAQFVREVESVDPRATGHPIQTWYASGELAGSYVQAAIYAILTVTALLMLDLGSIRLVILALVPVALSMLQLFGILTLFHLPLNAANTIVLPLIIGIGIDYGVHIVHDYRTDRSGAFRIGLATTLAIILTSATTMVGFGSMGIADHQGLRSLGIVLFVGVGLCLANSWFTLPVLLSFARPAKAFSSDSRETSQTASETDAPESHVGIRAEIPVWSRANSILGDVPVLLSLPNYPDA